MSRGHRGHNLIEGVFYCRGRDSGCKSTIIIPQVENNGNVELLGQYRVEVGEAECLADQC